MNAKRVFFLLSVLLAATVPLPAQDADLDARLDAVAKAYKPEFPAELPFNPSEWTTNEDYPLIGDPAAKKGGTIIGALADPLPTFRTDGPNSNLTVLSNMHGLVYETLLGIHSTTLEWYPGLASHWQFDYEKQTLRFRLDPKAQWPDGSPVTADDVLASWEHLAGGYRNGPDASDDAWSRKDPYAEELYGKSYQRPVAEDKYTIKVVMTEKNWRLPIYFAASMKIMPAKYIRISGEDYLNGYQWKLVPGTGPYGMASDGHVEGESYTLTRRDDYWAKDKRFATGLYNFDKVKWVVVRDAELLWEKFKKGDVDYYFVNKAQRWVEETDFEKVQRGWIQKRKVYTLEPQGFSGFCFNTRKPPFDDVRIRRAWAHLFHREKLIEKLFYNEYEMLDSYWPGGIYANPDNPEIRYNPRRAAQLLEEAGWKERNSDGILVKDGQPFEVTLEFGSPTFERIFTVLKEDYKAAGIELNLKLVDENTLIKKVDDRDFTIHYMFWGAILFPNPESSWMSELADQPNNNNLGGFKNERVDRLCKEYDACYEMKQRIQIVREIDKIIFREYPYALGWYGPYSRVMYWNKFGHPGTYFTATNRADADIPALWWYDPDKDQALQDAMKSNASLGGNETVVVRPFEGLQDISAGFGEKKEGEDGEDGREEDGDEDK